MLAPLILIGLGVLYVATKGAGSPAPAKPSSAPSEGHEPPPSPKPAPTIEEPSWFTPNVINKLSPADEKKREDGIVAILKRAGETGSKVLVSFLLRRSSAPTVSAVGKYELVGHGLVQSVTPGSPRGYVVSVTSFSKRTVGGDVAVLEPAEILDLPPVGSRFIVDNSGLLSITEYGKG